MLGLQSCISISGVDGTEEQRPCFLQASQALSTSSSQKLIFGKSLAQCLAHKRSQINVKVDVQKQETYKPNLFSVI